MTGPVFDLTAHLARQAEWSARTFGPGDRAQGIVDHLRKELLEVAADPTDLTEWVDVAILAFDGAWRAGYSPEAIVEALAAKHARNEARTWPDWRTADPEKAIEHVRSADEQLDAWRTRVDAWVTRKGPPPDGSPCPHDGEQYLLSLDLAGRTTQCALCGERLDTRPAPPPPVDSGS